MPLRTMGKSENLMKQKILSFLASRRHGASIDEVASSVAMSRVTASKYLAVLAAEGGVVIRNVGNTKLHYLAKNYTSPLATEPKGGSP